MFHFRFITKIIKTNFKKNGFTIIELMTVSAMIIILSLIVFINYRTGERQLTLQRATFKLTQDIRRIQSMAGLTEANCTHPNYHHGYGIHFKNTDPAEYFLFADCDGNGRYTGSDEIIETIEFERGVEIDSLKIDGVSKNQISIVFDPPFPSVYIDGDLAAIRINHDSNPSKTSTVSVNGVGLVDID